MNPLKSIFKISAFLFSVSVLALFSACGGGGGSNDGVQPPTSFSGILFLTDATGDKTLYRIQGRDAVWIFNPSSKGVSLASNNSVFIENNGEYSVRVSENIVFNVDIALKIEGLVLEFKSVNGDGSEYSGTASGTINFDKNGVIKETVPLSSFIFKVN